MILEGFFVLDQIHNIRYPIILIYADDILIIACNKEQLDKLLPVLKKHLEEVNLKLNAAKTKIIVRTPTGEAPASMSVDGCTYVVSRELDYLGVTITDRLCRRKTSKSRCIKAIRSSKAVIAFAKENQPSVEIGSLLYKSIISPTMTYGSQVSIITKHTRKSMRKYERQIVEELASCCTEKDNTPTGEQILGGKTVTKKIRALQMRYWGHIIRMEDNHLLKLAAKYKKSYRKRGRPSFTWVDIIPQNVDRFGDLSLGEWEELARDKERVTRKIEEIYDKPESTDSD
ncbi:uncharacterized protein LOC134206263 [Armigeres subalbatus]|uniref:uncharacterized protein LOC134206263 n=1 Tax=Armigeres subalbatus TaxID=124917 RepID=UPI002ED05267